MLLFTLSLTIASPGRQPGKPRDETAPSDPRGKIMYQLTKGLFSSAWSLIMPRHCCSLSEDTYLNVVEHDLNLLGIISVWFLRKIGSYVIQMLIKMAYLLDIRL